MNAVRPNFFIVGAPKCGTTALSEYLKEHPQVCFSYPKEPHFFATDLPSYRVVTRESDYLERCFGHCHPRCSAVGEGSVYYLFSKDAIPNLLEFNPHSRVVVMIRNPVDLVYSLHSQFLFNFFEEEEDFERAWALQEPRREGRCIPRGCHEPRLLQYREVAALGTQLRALMQVVRRDRLRVILFDDFVDDTRRVYERVLRFLDLTPDDRSSFSPANPSSRHVSRALGHALQNPPRWLMRLAGRVKRRLGIRSFGIGERLQELNTRPRPRPPLPRPLRTRIVKEFEDEIALLERLCGRDLSHWASAEPRGTVTA